MWRCLKNENHAVIVRVSVDFNSFFFTRLKVSADVSHFILQGHCRAGKIQDAHNSILQRGHGNFTNV